MTIAHGQPKRPCASVRQCFGQLEEGRLPTERKRQVRAHLDDCEPCRNAWEAWQAESRLLADALGPVAAPRDLAGEVAARIRKDMLRPAPRWRRRVVAWGLAAAAAVVIGALGLARLLAPRYVRVGEIAAVEGRPMARQRGARFASVVGQGVEVFDGATLMTGPHEALDLWLLDGSRLRLSDTTEVRLSGQAAQADCGHVLPHVCLRQGEVLCKLSSTRYFRAVGTPLGTAIVAGTEFRIRYVGGSRTVLEVLEGEVRFSCPQAEVRAVAGTRWVVRAGEGIPRQW